MHNISKVFPNKLIDFKFEGKSDRRIQLGNASYSSLKYCYGLNHPLTQIYDVSIGTRNLCLVGIPVRITFSILASNSSNITCNFMNHVTWRDRNNITFLLVLVTLPTCSRGICLSVHSLTNLKRWYVTPHKCEDWNWSSSIVIFLGVILLLDTQDMDLPSSWFLMLFFVLEISVNRTEICAVWFCIRIV